MHAQATMFALVGADDAGEASVAGRWAGIAGTLPSAEALARMLERPFVLHVSFFRHE